MDEIKCYETIKKYPSGPEVGTLVGVTLVPGHQWPEYYRPVYQEELSLLLEKKDLQEKLAAIERRLKFMRTPPIPKTVEYEES